MPDEQAEFTLSNSCQFILISLECKIFKNGFKTKDSDNWRLLFGGCVVIGWCKGGLSPIIWDAYWGNRIEGKQQIN